MAGTSGCHGTLMSHPCPSSRTPALASPGLNRPQVPIMPSLVKCAPCKAAVSPGEHLSLGSLGLSRETRNLWSSLSPLCLSVWVGTAGVLFGEAHSINNRDLCLFRVWELTKALILSVTRPGWGRLKNLGSTSKSILLTTPHYLCLQKISLSWSWNELMFIKQTSKFYMDLI